MDDKAKKITELKAQRQKIDDDIQKLKLELQAEIDAILKSGKPRNPPKPKQQQLPLGG
jgi:hypothetical protein